MTYNQILGNMASNILKNFANENTFSSLIQSNLIYDIENLQYVVKIYGTSTKNNKFTLTLSVNVHTGQFEATFNSNSRNKQLTSFDSWNLENYAMVWVYGFIGNNV